MAHKRFIFTLILFMLILAAFLALDTPECEAARREANLMDLLERRTVNCWPEGEMLGDLVIGARGKLTFLYVDSKLGNALHKLRTSGSEETEDENMPRMLVEFSGKFAARKGHSLFILYIESYRSWMFNTAMLQVGDYTLTSENLISGVMMNPEAEIPFGKTELPGNYSGILSFYVKNDFLKPGSEIKIGYDEYLMPWKVPTKTE